MCAFPRGVKTGAAAEEAEDIQGVIREGFPEEVAAGLPGWDSHRQWGIR